MGSRTSPVSAAEGLLGADGHVDALGDPLEQESKLAVMVSVST